MVHLKRGETFATGMVRPKTTALFFDKLWVHPFLINPYSIEDVEVGVPAELCVDAPLGAEEYYTAFLSNLRFARSVALPNDPKLDELGKRVSSVLGEGDFYTHESGLRVITVTDAFYELIRNALDDYVSGDEDLLYSFICDFQSASTEHYRDDHDSQPSGNVYLEPPHSVRDATIPWSRGLPTKYRNKAIFNLVKIYSQQGINLTPIYLNPTEYDEVLTQETSGVDDLIPEDLDTEQLSEGARTYLEQLLEARRVRAPIQKTPGLEICIDFVPTVLDSELTWQQVLEFRKDKKAREKLDRLRRWFTLELLEKSEEEIRNILSKRLDDYQWALKKHGILTVTGGTTSVLSFIAGPAVLQLLTASPLAAVAGGIALASGIAFWVTKKRIEKAEIQRDEVAYIYEVRRLEL